MYRRLILGVFLILAGLTTVFALVFYQPQQYTMNQAIEISENYLTSLRNSNLDIEEIMEFEQNFYVVYFEKSTGVGAFEMLIDKTTGRIFPEYGPNMMWNTKYGHGGMMGGWTTTPTSNMPITSAEAVKIAQDFLDSDYPGTTAQEAHSFYGYHTIHFTKGDKIYGMLSVNDYDGTVWYHNWHGSYIQSVEMHER